MPATVLQIVFQAIVVARLIYASPAWCIASIADHNRCEAFVHRSTQLEYRDPSDKTVSDICERADDTLSDGIKQSQRLTPAAVSASRFHKNVINTSPLGIGHTNTKYLFASQV